MRRVVLVVDVANVIGSRPDGWWRDRAGAAARLLALLGGLADATVSGPDGSGVVVQQVVAVLEGRARTAAGPDTVIVRPAGGEGDDEIVAAAAELVATGHEVLVVTADRGLRARLRGTAEVTGPGWLNDLLGR